MADTAAHLVDHVLPPVPVRQWVLSLPFGIRCRLAWDGALLRAVLAVFLRLTAACKQHGKFAGMGGMYTPARLERHIAMGVQLVLAGSDFSLLMQAGTARAALVRGFERQS